jgi:secreted Zn-dependent insulinase-like peptidase
MSHLHKPLLDERLYEQFQLPNGIYVTTVNDKRSEKSSCSLAVRIGAAADDLPGLAHITEHAVFLGSEKYPVENEYKKYLNKNGGGSNGGTSMEQTVYKFYVNALSFDQGVDIFSQFFKCPLLNAEAISREIHAVDSEDSKNRILEGRRFLQVLKAQVNEEIHYSKFSTGNLNTLAFGDVEKYGHPLAEKIQRFHSSYYLPESMAVCLVGPQSLEELKSLATEKFSTITAFPLKNGAEEGEVGESMTSVLEAKGSTILSGDQSSHKSIFKHINHPQLTTGLAHSSSPLLIKIKPTRELREMNIIWEFPYSLEKYKSNPCYLLSYLLNYKGEGSLFSRLQDLNYATSLSAHIRNHFSPHFTLFEMNISLTKEGFSQYLQIWSLLQEYLQLISLKENEKELSRIWNEMKMMKKISFLFEEGASAYETSPMIAESMLDYPLEDVLSAGQLLDEIDMKEFYSYLDRMIVSDAMKENSSASLSFLRGKEFTHLPGDDMNKLSELVKVFEEEQNSEMIEKMKLDGNYFSVFKKWLDERDLKTRSNSSSSVIEYEPFYGVPYEVGRLDSNHKTISEIVIKPAQFRLPAENRFISFELMHVTRDELRKGLKSSAAVVHENDMEWNEKEATSSLKLEGGESPLSKKSSGVIDSRKSDPPRLLAKYSFEENCAKELTDQELDLKECVVNADNWQKNVLWFSKDQIFGTPKSTVFFLFRSPYCGELIVVVIFFCRWLLFNFISY